MSDTSVLDILAECDKIRLPDQAYRSAIDLSVVASRGVRRAVTKMAGYDKLSGRPYRTAELASDLRRSRLGGRLDIVKQAGHSWIPQSIGRAPKPSEIGSLILAASVGDIVYGNEMDISWLRSAKLASCCKVAEEGDSLLSCKTVNVQSTVNRLWADDRLGREVPIYARALLNGILVAASNVRENPRNLPHVGACEIKSVLVGMGIPCAIACVMADAIVEAFGTSDKLTDKMIELGSMSQLLNTLSEVGIQSIRMCHG